MMMLNIPIYFDMKFTHHNFHQEAKDVANGIYMFFNLDYIDKIQHSLQLRYTRAMLSSVMH